jgi:DNA-binding SARP family transcriptional activator
MASPQGTVCTATSAVDISSGCISRGCISTAAGSARIRPHWSDQRPSESWPRGDGAEPGPGPGLELQVLGPMEVLRGGVPVMVPGRTTAIILAGLALSANQIVPNDTLIDWTWGAGRPARPRAALQSGISRLRRLVGGELVETAGLGYRLRAGAGQLDLLRFSELVATGARAADDGAPERALVLLDRALRLWRGNPLSNVDSPALHRDALPGLSERYLRAVEQRSDLSLRLGRYPAVVQELSVIVRQHPFHERLAGQLMIALVKSGRRADALAAYERLRQALAGELGIDPGAALQALRGRILHADGGREVRDRRDQPDWLREFWAEAT